MTFAWPWALLLLPLPWLVWRFWPSAEPRDRLEHPYLIHWANPGAGSDKQSGSIGRGFWLWLVWGLMVLALVRPQTLGPPLVPETPARNLMLVVDMSGSMQEADMEWQNQRITRYQAVQSVVSDFVERRQGDAVGLVVFGDFADIQAPLTPDTQAVSELLAGLRPGMAGENTAIGDGLGLAVKRLRALDARDKVVILLSDGENTAGKLTPDQGAEAAAASDIRVHTIAFGGEIRPGMFGMLSGAGVDERALTRIAEQTEGQFFRARSTGELEAVYQQLDKLEPSPRSGQELRLAREWFWLPAGLAWLLLVLGPLLQHRRGIS